MSGLAKRIVWTFPFLGDVAATIRGWQLNRQRYGDAYRQAVKGLQERDTWPLERLRAYQDDQLRQLVALAAKHVPHYRRVFAERGLRPDDIRTVEDLPKLPALEKTTMRGAPATLIDERLDPDRLVTSQTSGTTGVPVRPSMTREAIQRHYAQYEVRCRRVAGLEFGKRPYVMFGSQAVVSPSRRKPPFWVYNHAWKQLYMSLYHLSDEHLPAYADALRARPYQAIMGFPFPIYLLARHVQRSGGPPIKLDAAITSGEVLQPHWRETIESAFDCHVYDQYSCAEQCVFASECAHGGMHISIDACVLEVVDDNDRPVPPGEYGQFLCTGLLNDAQPMIRYRIGDRGALSPEPCPCGSPLPTIAAIEGRSVDGLLLPDGRRISILSTSSVLGALQDVSQWQIVQESIDRFRFRVVLDRRLSEDHRAKLIETLRRVLGDVSIEVEQVNEIERTASGKVVMLVSHIEQNANTQ